MPPTLLPTLGGNPHFEEKFTPYAMRSTATVARLVMSEWARSNVPKRSVEHRRLWAYPINKVDRGTVWLRFAMDANVVLCRSGRGGAGHRDHLCHFAEVLGCGG